MRRSSRIRKLFSLLGLVWFGSLPGTNSAAAQARTPQDFFDQYGAGTRTFEKPYGAYWSPHIQKSRQAILEAANAARGRSSALVLGAGQCREIPLEELARQFERVILTDLDRDSMEEAVKRLPEELRTKVEIRVTDVTSFALPTMERIREAVRASQSPQEAWKRIERIFVELQRSEKRPPSLPRVDLVISSLVLSELHHYPPSFARTLVREKWQTAGDAELGQAGEQLKRFAMGDHVALLSRFCGPGGAIYFADTIARGPFYDKMEKREQQKVLWELLPELARRGLFQVIKQETPARERFLATVGVMRLQHGSSPLNDKQAAELLERLSSSTGGESAADSAAVSEAIVHMVGQGLLPVGTEIEILESVMERYERMGGGALESLVPLDLLEAEWKQQGLRPIGPPGNWWWLAYPYAIPQNWGAFRVRSWALRRGR